MIPIAVLRSRARKGGGAALRREIIEAAEQLLAERGSAAAVSIRDVAEAVGVTPPAIYLHFADKDQLFYECCRRGFEEFAARLVPILTSAGSPIQRIHRLGAEYIEYGLENWQQYRVLFSGSPPSSVPSEALADDPGHRVLVGLVGLVEEAQEAGEVRSDLDPAALAAALWGVVHGTVHILLLRRTTPELLPIPADEQIIAAALQTGMSGIATTAGKRRLPAFHQ